MRSFAHQEEPGSEVAQPACTHQEIARQIKAQIADPEEADILLDRLWDAWELLDELKHRLGKRRARRVLCAPAPRLDGSVHRYSSNAPLSRGGR
jgi:hypothetical protein